MQLTAAELSELGLTLRRSIQQEHGIAVVGLLLLKPHQARKVRRCALQACFAVCGDIQSLRGLL